MAVPITENSYLGIPSEKVLLGLLVANMIQLLGWIGKQVWEMNNKKEDKTEDKIDDLTHGFARMEETVKNLADKFRDIPDEDKMVRRMQPYIENAVLRATKGFK